MRRRKENRRENAEPEYSTELRPVIKLRLAKQGIFFGPGAANLLEHVEETGSIQEACARMELSYSKGSRIIKNTEKELGFKLLERWTGGNGGGGSRLTAEGRQLLDCYLKLTHRVQEYAEEIFGECFSNESEQEQGSQQ